MHESQILKEIKERRAYRSLSSNPINRETLNNILKASSLAPSCFNKQPWKYIIADKEDVLKEIHQALPENNKWAEKAPAVIIALTGIELDCSLPDKRDYALLIQGFQL